VAARQRTRNRVPPERSSEPPAATFRQNATLNEFAAQWLKRRAPRSRQADTQRLRDHVLPLLGARRLRELRAGDVAEVIRLMLAKKGMNVKSARNAHAVFAELLGDALGQGLIALDPRGVPTDIWPPDEVAPEPRFSPAEVRALTSDERLDLDQRIYDTLAFYSGLESGEICGLRFDDWVGRVRSPVAPELGAALERWQHGGFESVYGRAPRGDDWLVPRRSDVALSHSEGSAYKGFRRACVTLGIKTRSPRAVRATFGTESTDSPGS
jgi:integrase